MYDDIIIFCAKYLYVLAVIITLVYFFKLSSSSRKAFSLLAVVSLIFIYGIAKISSLLYFDPRPFVIGHFMPLIPHAADNGYPSDHILLTSAIASIVFLFNKKISAVLWIISIIIGWARVAAGIHHPIDIIGAIIISIAVTLLMDLILRKQKRLPYQH
jgi:undecaprenyl-diphosphatase